MTRIEDILEVLGCDDFSVGTEDPRDVAAAWLDEGFTAREVGAWIHVARCWCASAAGRLRDAGLTPDEAATLTSEGTGGYVETIGYKVANCDLSAEDAVRIARA
jgi:hypothetical protein